MQTQTEKKYQQIPMCNSDNKSLFNTAQPTGVCKLETYTIKYLIAI